MKKLILISALVVCMAFVMIGCGAKTQQSNKNTQTFTSDVQAIKDRGVLIAGVKQDAIKFGYKNPTSGQYEGLEIDLAKAISKKIFGDENKVQFITVTEKTRGPVIENDETDIVIATYTITEERKQKYNFSDSYYTDGIGLLVNKSSDIKSFRDLDGKKIGVIQTATTKDALKLEADKIGIKVTFVEYEDCTKATKEMLDGNINCFSIDAGILATYVNDSTEILPDRYDPQDYGISSKKGNDGLAKLVNDTISEMKTSGELGSLIEKWGL